MTTGLHSHCAIMSRDRFCLILHYVHVADNSKAPQCDDPGFDKLCPLLDFISKRCLQLYSPHIQLSIDESMIGTKCQLSFIQYMPKKPVKMGSRFGYVLTLSWDIFAHLIYYTAEQTQNNLILKD